MQDDFVYHPEIMKSQLSMLPPIEQLTLQQLANKRKINFNMMLSLPFLLKDKALEDRKDTIAIYRKHKFEPLKPQKHKVTLINSGRIHCPEFWSDKYQSTALRGSHIDRNLDKYRQIIKNNIQDYLVKFEMQAKEQLEESKKIKYQEIFKKQCSISDEECAPSNNELNLSQCTQDEIINYYRDVKRQDSAKKTSLRNLDKITCSSVKQSFIEKFDKVITTCDRNSIPSNRNSLDSINTCGYRNIKQRNRHVVGSKTCRSHYN
ncbi:unnamed protein product (macronuclear) [Paramecium tetraurelia]|uniref:Uncharacterized protein n=1 Tax=Paramecium tetraurelia TaxID=5888 RepID=A0CYZ2_PARTE|nr:uncharacterized protein GSPATT00011610001 [Paramecium tetraurelia]CAK76009.1 unnamed protein product [Paramecium tetraurelia]|eukprot:XP_001443406.1 hypothetical protein (macronuclear) [Paramecium tetraurelia strain d4-2]